MANFGKEVINEQANFSSKLTKRDKQPRESIMTEDASPIVSKKPETEDKIPVKTEPNPAPAPRDSPDKESIKKPAKKKIIDSDSDSSSPRPAKKKSEKKQEKSSAKSSNKKPAESLAKRPPQRKKKVYDSDEEDESEDFEDKRPQNKAKTSSQGAKKTKKLQLDDSDLELMQQNARKLTKDGKKSNERKPKVARKARISESDEPSDYTQSEQESDSEY